MSRKVYMVEHLYSYGWDDADWSEDGEPLRWISPDAAREYVREHVQELNHNGMDYSTDEFRVVEVPHG